MQTNETKRPSCISATGNPLEIVAEAKIKFQLGRVPLEHEFKVAKNLRKTLILGSDFLGNNNASIDFKRRELTIGGRYVISLGKRTGRKSDGKLHLPAVIIARKFQHPDQVTLNMADAVMKNKVVDPNGEKKKKDEGGGGVKSNMVQKQVIL